VRRGAIRSPPSCARTLQRRLEEEATSFIQLLDGTRRELAEQYLGRMHLSLAQAGYLLGFADQSSFFRACKRALSPGQYRNQLLGQSAERPDSVSEDAPEHPFHLRPEAFEAIAIDCTSGRGKPRRNLRPARLDPVRGCFVRAQRKPSRRGRRNPPRTERRMGRSAGSLHDPGNDRAVG
jgi:hypothetical protein